MISHSHTRPTLCVLLGAFMISFSAVFVKIANVTPTTSGFYRVFFGAIFLLIIYLTQKKPAHRVIHLVPITCFCGFIFALDLFFWHESILYIGPGLATILGNFQVFLLAGAGVLFFGEKLGVRYVSSIPLAITGLFFIVGFEWNALTDDYKIGLYFGVLTAICYSIFILCLRKIQATESHSEVLNLFLVSIFSAFFLALKMFYNSDSFAIPDIESGMALLGLGFLCQTVGWLLISHGLPRIRASLAGLLLLIQPSLSFLWDVTIFHRPTDLMNWVGVTLTLTAIYLGVTSKDKSS